MFVSVSYCRDAACSVRIMRSLLFSDAARSVPTASRFPYLYAPSHKGEGRGGGYIHFLCLKNHQNSMVMHTVSIIATGKPHQTLSMPLMRFMPNNDAMSVGNIMIMEMEVSIFMTCDTLLLIRLA